MKADACAPRSPLHREGHLSLSSTRPAQHFWECPRNFPRLFLAASAKFPAAKFVTAKLTRHQPPFATPVCRICLHNTVYNYKHSCSGPVIHRGGAYLSWNGKVGRRSPPPPLPVSE